MGMIYYKEGTTVLCETRCGHSSMKAYLGVGSARSIEDMRNEAFSSVTLNNKGWLAAMAPHDMTRIILVVRNPYDRLLSMATHRKHMEQDLIRIAELRAEGKWPHGYERSGAQIDGGWITDHSAMYLHLMEQQPITHHILHEKLRDYIPVSSDTSQYTFEKGCTEYANWMAQYYTRAELEKEYQAYLNIIERTQELTVKEWRLI